MRKLFCAVLILSVLLATQIPSYAQRPAVDGFLGVPWGASKAQVQAAMAKKGFTLLEHRGDSGDVYWGPFNVIRDYPATFDFIFEDNVFYAVNVQILPSQKAENPYRLVMDWHWSVYQALKEKYGPPDEWAAPIEDINGMHAHHAYQWENIPTTVTPPGKVTISINSNSGICLPPIPSSYSSAACITLWYSIGKRWARQKSGKGDEY